MTLQELYKNSCPITKSTCIDMWFYIYRDKEFIGREEKSAMLWQLTDKHSPQTVINEPFSGWFIREVSHEGAGDDYWIKRMRVTYDLSEEEYAAHADINGIPAGLPCTERGDLPADAAALEGGPCSGYSLDGRNDIPCFMCQDCPGYAKDQKLLGTEITDQDEQPKHS